MAIRISKEGHDYRGRPVYVVREDGAFRGGFTQRSQAKREAKSLRAAKKATAKHPKKLRRFFNPSARAKSQRMTAALKKYLHSVYPHKTLAGAKIKKNPGGSITIVPIHLRKRSR